MLDITPGNFAAPLPCSYPAMGKESRKVKYNPRDMLAVWDALLEQERVATDAMAIDLIWVGRQLLGDLFLIEKQAFDKAYQEKDKKAFYAHSDIMFELLSDLDCLNSHHPHATLAHWLQQARDLGNTTQLKDYYEMNARRLITTWGGSLNDYACRNWNGLMWDYYTKRWENYIRGVTVAVITSAGSPSPSSRAMISTSRPIVLPPTSSSSNGSPRPRSSSRPPPTRTSSPTAAPCARNTAPNSTTGLQPINPDHADHR